jgi:hypothetical protein
MAFPGVFPSISPWSPWDFQPRHVPGTAEVKDRQHWAFALPVPAEGQDAARRVVFHLEDLVAGRLGAMGNHFEMENMGISLEDTWENIWKLAI